MSKDAQHNPLVDFLTSLTGTQTTASSERPQGGSGAQRSEDVPLVNANDADLRNAFADNLYALFRDMQVLAGAILQQSQGLSRHLAFPFNPMFKGVWSTRLHESSADDGILDSIRWFREQDAPFFFWWVDERDQPGDLADRLIANGFAPWETRAPGMAAPLDGLRYDLLDRVPAGYIQMKAHDAQTLADFAKAFAAGLEVPEWAGQAWVDATLAADIDASPWRPWVGYLDGEPVASNILYCGAGVASVFGVGTAPAARGQGIGAAITLDAFAAAREAGYRYGALFATEMGLPVYRRIGMHETGTTISRFLWRPA